VSHTKRRGRSRVEVLYVILSIRFNEPRVRGGEEGEGC
jgi:hypothetical protein